MLPSVAPNKWALTSLAACLLAMVNGCSSKEPAGESLGKARLKLQTPVAAFGFEEGSGNAIADNSGNGHNTTLAGQARVAGKYGSALEFFDNYVTIPDSSLLDLTTGMTLSAWVWLDEDQDDVWSSVIYKEGPTQAVYGLDASSPFQGRPPVTFLDSGSADAFAFPEAEEDELAELPKLTWTHLAATYDGSNLRLWINGDQAASTPFSQPILASSAPLRLGGTALFEEFFFGKIDEVRIYDRALTEDEIEHDLHRPVNPSGPDTTAPSVSLTAPSNNGKVAGMVPLTATASDNISVAGVEFYVDGSSIGEDEWPPFEITWNATVVANGNHTIRAEARDAAGNLGSTSTITVGLINNSLVAAYNFDQGSGTVLHDVTGNGNDGVLDGQAWVAGKYGQALEFDASFVTVADSQVLDLHRMTLSAWVKPIIPQFNWPTIALKEHPGHGLAYSLYSGWEEHPPSICLGVVEDEDGCVHGGATPPGVWTHLAGTYDGSVFRMYVNGNLAGTATPEHAPAAITSGALRIGGNAEWGNEFFDGVIDDLRIYNRAQTEAEIEQDMATPVTGGGGGCGSGCSDGNVCNGVETCVSGSCVPGTPPVVDDQNPCTTDSCHPTNGVTHVNVANGTACNDGDLCTNSSSCQAGTCVGSNPVVCTALDQCHNAGTCNPATGVCSNPNKPNGTSCSDGNACTASDTCQSGSCTAGSTVPTDDGNACTTDGCDPSSGVTHTPVAQGTPCSDQDVCNGSETCNTIGFCSAGTPLPTDDANPCTADACDPTGGVTHTPIAAGTACTDGNVCNGAEACSASGVCQAGTPLNTNDGNPCTADACDAVAGVTHTTVPSGTACPDGNACNGDELCNASAQCVAGAAVPTDDGNACTTDMCNPANGAVTHSPLPAGTLCQPDACTMAALCNAAGECIGGAPIPIDDGVACTLDVCDPVTGPEHRPCAPLDPTVSSSVHRQLEWLYTGADPIQTGVAPGTIEARRASGIHGTVKDAAGFPLQNVVVTVNGRPELGQTITRADGAFDMVVNGGGQLTVTLEKDGYIAAQRTENVPWSGGVQVDPVVLLRPDPVVTQVNLANAPEPLQVARGSIVGDADGIRQGTVLVPAGTQATMHLPGGGTTTLAQMNIRITEFTVGPNGPSAMPAALPPTSNYTYAFEINADEALDAGASSITFSQPLVYYLENFMAFPVGIPVPVGSYDPKTARWVAEPSGIVIGIASESGGMADIDVTGDGIADGATQLSALGITDVERQKLALLYAPGQSLWRVKLGHFSTWDCNWGVFPPDDMDDPPPPRDPEDEEEEEEEDPCEKPAGSTVACESQVLRESVRVAGTPFRLTYSSDRAPGRDLSITDILLSGPSVPASLKRIDLQVDVGGRTIIQSFPPLPNQTTQFHWDGKDKFGRTLVGKEQMTVTVRYAYWPAYASTASFAAFPTNVPITGSRERGEFYREKQLLTLSSIVDTRPLGLGGWNISEHHTYDAEGQVLLMGDGSRRTAEARPRSLRRVASLIGVGAMRNMAIGPDGSVYVSNPQLCIVRKISPTGAVTTIAGTGECGTSSNLFNLPATQTRLWIPSGLAVAPDGSVYVADKQNHVVRRINPNGSITTVAGNFSQSGAVVDGAPATSSMLSLPTSLALGPDGSLYVSHRLNSDHRLRKISPNGIISTIAGGQNPLAARQHDVPAATEPLGWPLDDDAIEVSPSGEVYFIDVNLGAPNSHLVRRIDTQGIIHLVAGCNQCSESDGGVPATSVFLDRTNALAVGANGLTFINPQRTISGSVVKTVAQIGVDATYRRLVGGTTDRVVFSNGEIATRVNLGSITDMTFGPDGLYFTDPTLGILRVDTALPTFAPDEFSIASEDGTRLFVFDADGRHVKTNSTLTKATLYSFDYDTAGRLAAITDGNGNVTSIAHDANGHPVSITGPFGQMTQLNTDTNGFLSSITSPLGDSVQATYTATGLMVAYRDELQGLATMTYDVRGRLITDTDAAGALISLATEGTPSDSHTTFTSGEGRVTEYFSNRLPSGVGQRTTVFPDGTQARAITELEGSHVLTLPNGTVTRQVFGSDPRWGQDAPTSSVTTTLPSGLSRTETQARVLTLSNPLDLSSLLTLENQSRVNDRLTRSVYNAASRIKTITSPAGRQNSVTTDPQGRPTRLERPGVEPIVLQYDARGRLLTSTQGTRVSTIAYDPVSGYAVSTTNGLAETTVASRDAFGRIVNRVLPDASAIAYGWDAAGNLTSVTPPGRPQHLQAYTPVHLLGSYTPPPLPGLSAPDSIFTHDLDRMLRVTSRPDAMLFERVYDGAGKLDFITSPMGTYDYQYYGFTTCAGCSPGELSRITSPSGINLDFTYDGALVKSNVWSGAINGTLSFTYDTDFRVAVETVTAGAVSSVIRYGYDADSLLVCASPTTCSPAGTNALKVTFDPAIARITQVDLGTAPTRETRTYNAYGELASLTARHGSTTLYSEVMDTTSAPRDALGRVTTRVETMQTGTSNWQYLYDTRGRLREVLKNSASLERFVYDSNGNRTSRITPAETWTGTYDDQDRLLSYGPYTYTYTANGELRTKTDASSSATTTYTYDVRGNLVRVDLPGGTVIEYLIDGMDRRVGKKRNGTLEKQWLYRDPLRIAAELDGAGSLISRFVYASGENVPDFVIRGTTTYRVFSDHLRSPRVGVNVANANDVPLRLEYATFGAATGTGAGWMPHGFAGGMYDADTGLLRFGARDYDPQSGRWLSKDPIRFDSGGTNLFVYAENDPVNFVDLDGHNPFPSVEAFLETMRNGLERFNCFLNPAACAERDRQRDNETFPPDDLSCEFVTDDCFNDPDTGVCRSMQGRCDRSGGGCPKTARGKACKCRRFR
jgi:RHS repeat-associated protein